MSDDARWAARYQFLEELWRGRERVLVDSGLEAVLRDGGPGVAHRSHPPLQELVDEIVPVDTVAVRVWMAVADVDTARDLGRLRGGTRFVPRSQLAGLLRTEGWEVAVVDLAPFLAAQPEQAPADDSAPRRDSRGRFLPRAAGPARPGPVDRDGKSLLRLLGAGVSDRGRTVVLVVPAREFPQTRDGLSYEEVARLVAEHLGGGRVYGLFAPPMAGVVQYGDAIEAGEDVAREEGEETGDEEERSEEGGDDDEDAVDEEEVPLSFDNTLGEQSPAILEFVAVAGTDVELGDGLTLIELPASGPAAEARESGAEAHADASGMRAQLAEAMRQADLAAIERQELIEQADRILYDREALQEEVDELRERLARLAADSSEAQLPVPVIRGKSEVSFDLDDDLAVEDEDDEVEPWPEERPDEQERMDAVLAREQQARWQLGKALDEIDALRKRPVEELEAEVARLRAQLEALSDVPAPAAVETAEGEQPQPSGEPGETRSPPDARARARASATRALDRLVRKVEREGIGALELRRELMTLSRLLRS